MNFMTMRLSLYFAVAIAITVSGCFRPRTVTVRPVETDEVLVNPGMGFTTFYSFNGDPINANHPAGSIAYFRWYWDVLEPEEGRVNFAMIDSVLGLCREHGQKLAFRVMCQNGHEVADKTVTVDLEVPLWFHRSGARGWMYPEGGHWQPDYDDPLFLEKHGNLIRALGGRYDGHPDLDHVDIGSVGRWGEWHTEGLPFPMPTLENHKKVIDFYVDSFRRTPLVMNLEESPATQYAISRGTGWRADCLGDMSVNRFFDEKGNGENHQQDRYPRIIGKYVPPEAWKNSPVVFETCWNMGHWLKEGWDVKAIFDQALEWHASVLNNKSFEAPPELNDEVEAFQKRMGYRLVLTELSHPDRARPGDSLNLTMTWINRGVAPCYLNHPPAVALRNPLDGTLHSMETGLDITGWLPGEHPVSAEVCLPRDIADGDYELLVGLLDPWSRKPRIRLAIEGGDSGLWYRVGMIQVR